MLSSESVNVCSMNVLRIFSLLIIVHMKTGFHLPKMELWESVDTDLMTWQTSFRYGRDQQPFRNVVGSFFGRSMA